MSAIQSSQLSNLAAGAGNYIAPTLLLKKALDTNESQVSALLASLPQKENTGKNVDVQA